MSGNLDFFEQLNQSVQINDRPRIWDMTFHPSEGKNYLCRVVPIKKKPDGSWDYSSTINIVFIHEKPFGKIKNIASFDGISTSPFEFISPKTWTGELDPAEAYAIQHLDMESDKEAIQFLTPRKKVFVPIIYREIKNNQLGPVSEICFMELSQKAWGAFVNQRMLVAQVNQLDTSKFNPFDVESGVNFQYFRSKKGEGPNGNSLHTRSMIQIIEPLSKSFPGFDLDSAIKDFPDNIYSLWGSKDEEYILKCARNFVVSYNSNKNGSTPPVQNNTNFSSPETFSDSFQNEVKSQTPKIPSAADIDDVFDF